MNRLVFFIIAGVFFFKVEGQTLFKKNDVGGVSQDSLFLKNNAADFTELTEAPGMMQIDLDEVVLVGRLRFKNRSERRQYLILKYKTEKVWPYAVLAAERLTELNNRLSTIESNSKKRKYIRIVQKYIKNEFTGQLKKLTKTEGQILVKLMYRQTGKTTFDVVKELKSGWRAFWYNTTASLFDISLKEKYDPQEVGEDYLIEHILRRSFQRGKLEEHKAKIPIDFAASMEKWRKQAAN